VRLAALDLEEDLRGGSGGFWARSWDSEVYVFHLIHKFLTFYLNATFLCNSVELMSMVVMCVLESHRL